MTRDDIIRIAEKSGISHVWINELERFAELVAAAECEACIRALEANEQFYCRDTIRARGEK
jgi:hypothetical protein